MKSLSSRVSNLYKCTEDQILEREGVLSTLLLSGFVEGDKVVREYVDSVSSEFKSVDLVNAINESKVELSAYVDKSVSDVLLLSGVLVFRGVVSSYELLVSLVGERHVGDVYLVNSSVEGEADEYVYTKDGWKLIGNIKLDKLVSDYALSSEVSKGFGEVVSGFVEGDKVVREYVDRVFVKSVNGVGVGEGGNVSLVASDLPGSELFVLSSDLLNNYYTKDQVEYKALSYVSNNKLNDLNIDLSVCELSSSNVNVQSVSGLELSSLVPFTKLPNGEFCVGSGSRTPNLIYATVPSASVVLGAGSVNVPHFESDKNEVVEFWETVASVSALKCYELRSFINLGNTNDVLAVPQFDNTLHYHRYPNGEDISNQKTTDYNLTGTGCAFKKNKWYTFIFKIRIIKVNGVCKNFITLDSWFETTSNTLL